MKRPIQHVISKKGELLLNDLLPKEWIIRPVSSDYGVDFEVEVVDGTDVTGHRFWVQLRTSEKVSWSKTTFNLEKFEEPSVKVDTLRVPLKRKHADYYYRTSIPVLLFRAVLGEEDIYWLPVRAFYRYQMSYFGMSRVDALRVPLSIPRWQSVKQEFQHNFPGLRWFAYEPGRMVQLVRLIQMYDDVKYENDYLRSSISMQGLAKCADALEEALQQDLLFGVDGVDFLRDDPVARFAGVPAMATLIKDGLLAAKALLSENVNEIKGIFEKDLKLGSLANSETFPWSEEEMLLFLLRSKVTHAVDMLVTASGVYEGFHSRHLLTEAHVARSIVVKETGIEFPIFPMSQKQK